MVICTVSLRRETLDRKDPRARPATLDRTEAADPMETRDPWVRPDSRDCRETSEELDYPAFLVRYKFLRVTVDKIGGTIPYSQATRELTDSTASAPSGQLESTDPPRRTPPHHPTRYTVDNR